jgi:hypothetical protein
MRFVAVGTTQNIAVGLTVVHVPAGELPVGVAGQAVCKSVAFELTPWQLPAIISSVAALHGATTSVQPVQLAETQRNGSFSEVAVEN